MYVPGCNQDIVVQISTDISPAAADQPETPGIDKYAQAYILVGISLRRHRFQIVALSFEQVQLVLSGPGRIAPGIPLEELHVIQRLLQRIS